MYSIAVVSGLPPSLAVPGPFHTAWPGVHGDPLLIAVILLAGTGTTALFLLSAVALYRRRTRRYLLVTLAVGALAARSVVGLGTVMGIVPMATHHIVEHGLDFLIAVLILCAVYTNAPSRPLTESE